MTIRNLFINWSILTVLIFTQFTGLSSNKGMQSLETNKDYKKLSLNRPNLNLSILLDLSDRISTKINSNEVMEIYKRDIGYIEAVANAFVTHCLNKKVIKMNDRMQLFMDPLPVDSEINTLLSNLKIDINKNTATQDYLMNIETVYSQSVSAIYENSISKEYYPGSDIWRFFNSKIEDYCIKDGYKNVLVILTDGYLFHENSKIQEGSRKSFLTPKTISQLQLTNSNWKNHFATQDLGFITTNANLNNIEVLVLGINPAKSNPYEEDVIKKFWGKWFSEMGIINWKFKTADLPTHLHESIQYFIWEEY